MRELVFLLEEASAKAMLEGLVPRLLDDRIQVRLITFEGKQDLEKQLPLRLRGYLNPHARFLVLRDQEQCARLQIGQAPAYASLRKRWSWSCVACPYCVP